MNHHSPKKEKRYAAANHAHLHAAIQGLFRFATLDQAREVLQKINAQFVISRRAHLQPGELPSAAPDALTLWVRGYAITEDELTQGYKGNFLTLTPTQEKDYFTLHAEKLAVPLPKHPDKVRPRRRHPDWGHPILREIKKETVYPTLEEASARLERLHIEFPDVSIPGGAYLLLMLYERGESRKNPVRKYRFDVELLPEGGGFTIRYRINERTKLAIKPQPDAAPHAEPGEADAAEAKPGHFANMVALKRLKRKRPTS